MIRYLINVTKKPLEYKRSSLSEFPYLILEPAIEFCAELETFLMIQQNSNLIRDITAGLVRVGYESGETYADPIDSLLCLLDKIGDVVYVYDPDQGVVKIAPEIIIDPETGIRGPNITMGIFMSLEDVFKNKNDPVYDKIKVSEKIKKKTVVSEIPNNIKK